MMFHLRKALWVFWQLLESFLKVSSRRRSIGESLWLLMQRLGLGVSDLIAERTNDEGLRDWIYSATRDSTLKEDSASFVGREEERCPLTICCVFVSHICEESSSDSAVLGMTSLVFCSCYAMFFGVFKYFTFDFVWTKRKGELVLERTLANLAQLAGAVFPHLHELLFVLKALPVADNGTGGRGAREAAEVQREATWKQGVKSRIWAWWILRLWGSRGLERLP